MIRRFLLTLALALAGAFAQTALAQTVESDGLLRDGAGRTLYVFDNDFAAGLSNCYGGCAEAWPAFEVPIGAEVKDELSVHARADGRMQWGWNGRPLYYFAGDTRPGDATGDGRDGLWHAVRPGATRTAVGTSSEVQDSL
jgi:predicted lipoprotein with Yx(FWY)xxD motif